MPLNKETKPNLQKLKYHKTPFKQPTNKTYKYFFWNSLLTFSYFKIYPFSFLRPTTTIFKYTLYVI